MFVFIRLVNLFESDLCVNSSHVLQVYIYMRTDRIIKMDIKEQSLDLVLDELFCWQDKNLTWQDDAGLHTIILKAGHVWTPDIYAENILEEKTIRSALCIVTSFC